MHLTCLFDPIYRFERSLVKEADYYRLEPTLTTPIGAFGGRAEWGYGRARIVPRQQNVFGSDEPLPWHDGSLFTWNAWYGLKLPDDADLEAGGLAGYWGQDGGAGHAGEVGAQSVHVRGPFLYGHAYEKAPWGRGRGGELELICSDVAIEGFLPTYKLEEDIHHIDGKLVATACSTPKLDVFGVLYRIQEDHDIERVRVPASDPLPRSLEFDATEYRVGPGLRYRYSNDPLCSFSVAPLLVFGESTGGYIYPTSERASVIEDWSAAGEFTNLDLEGSFGMECAWESPDVKAGVDLIVKSGQGDVAFPGPVALPGMPMPASGIYGFDHEREEMFVRMRIKLKGRPGDEPRWWHGISIEPAVRHVQNRGRATVDVPALEGLGADPRVLDRRTKWDSRLYYVGLAKDKLWVFDRVSAGFGHDSAESQDYGYIGIQLTF